MSLKPTTAGWQQDLGQAIASVLSGGAGGLLRGITGIEESPESIVSDWSKYVATPAMQMWQKTIAPLIEEGYNLPGAFYSASKSRGLARNASDFFTQNVTPTLFSALENMKGREVNLASIYAGLLGTSAGLSTAQTLTYVNKGSWQQDFAAFGQGFNSLYSGMSSAGADVAALLM